MEATAGLGIRANVLAMSPYVPGKPIEDVRRELGLQRVVKLASNENPFGPSPLAIAAVREAATQMHLYPDGSSRLLREAICAKFGVGEENVILGNGSDEIIHLLGVMFLDGDDDELMMGDPGFSRYDASAFLAASRLKKVPLDAEYRHDLAQMAAEVSDQTRLIFVANPNNPTGTIVRRTEFERFLDALPPHVLVVLDEAYGEFAAHISDYPSSLDYVREGRNVVGLRTFSKAYGLAGLRIGFGFAPAAVTDAFHRAREPFNVNSLAQAAAVAALQDDAHVAKTAEANREGVARLNAIFRSVGAVPVESFANFAYADLGYDAGPVFQALMQRGIIVRAGAHVGHPQCLRVSVGTPEEIDAFETAFRQVVLG